MKRVVIRAGDDPSRTIVTIDGVLLTRVARLRLELDAKKVPEVHLTLAMPLSELDFEFEADTIVKIEERP